MSRQPQLGDRRAKILEVRGVDREEPAEDDGLRRLEAGQGSGAGLLVVGDRVADARVGHLLDLRGDEADLAGAEHGHVLHLGPEDADLVHLVMGARAHHLDLLALLERAVEDAHQHDDAEIGVVPAVDQQGLQRRLLVAGGRRQAGDDRLQHVGNSDAGLGGDEHRIRGVEADHLLDLLLDAVGFGGRQVDLVQNGHDLVSRVDRLIDIGERLRLDALRSVDHEERALAGLQGARHLIGEVDMAGRVHQIEDVVLPVLRPVVEAHGLRLDGDAALALDVHGVEHLLDHLTRGEGSGLLDQPVGEGRLAVVDMGDNREVADIVDLVGGAHGAGIAARARKRKGAVNHPRPDR